jgi:hypothetical protein
MNKSGFSLFEIMISCALLILIATCTFIYQQNVDQFMIQTYLNTLYMTCMTLSQKAQLSKQNITLTFNLDKNSYSYQNHSETLPSFLIFGYPPGSKGPPSSPQSLITHPITFTHNQIIFYKDGTIQSGTIYITNAQRTLLFALSSPIAQISYLRRYHYVSDKWIILP